MKRFYNKRKDLQNRKTRFNPDYWEVPVDHAVLSRLADSRGLWYETSTDHGEREQRRDRVARLMPAVRDLIDQRLTRRQQEIVHLYFFERKTVYEIADCLGIAAPSVSQHLFGKKRGGQRIGGAIAKLRKDANLTQERLALKIHSTKSAISRYESAHYSGYSLPLLKKRSVKSKG